MIAFIGYLASAMVLGTFGMRTMMPLRIAALATNIVVIAYAALTQLHVVLVIQIMLLPLNVWRLIEIQRLVKKLRGRVDEHAVFDALLPFAKRLTVPEGELVIRRGDPSDSLYLVLDGTLHVREAAIDLGPGTIVGEIGVLSASHVRTATVAAKTDCLLARISAEDFQRVYYTNPAVGLSLVRLIIERLTKQVDAGRMRTIEAPA
jgi:hypothetical protein